MLLRRRLQGIPGIEARFIENVTGHMSSALDLEVDEHCRVKGVTGVWVADSSIIPQVTRANTNATAIMIGERVAGWVAGA